MRTLAVGAINEIVAFGEDAADNFYVVDLSGEIFRVVGPTPLPVAGMRIAVLGYAQLTLAPLLSLVGLRARRRRNVSSARI